MRIKQQVRLAVIALVFPLIMPMNTAVASEDSATIPVILENMENHAEDIVGALLAKDEAASHRDYQQLWQDMKQLHKMTSTKPSNERRSRELLMAFSWMRVINIEINSKSWIGAAIGANQLSGMVIQASDYPTSKQRDIAWMDYLGREIELLTLESPKANAELLKVRLITLENTWARVSNELIKNFKNKPLLMQGDTLVTNLKESKKPAETVALAKKLLLFVNTIEKTK